MAQRSISNVESAKMDGATPSPLPSYAAAVGGCPTSQSDSLGTVANSVAERSATASVCSFAYTATESWADDDSCWLQALSDVDGGKKKASAPPAGKGWKTVPSSGGAASPPPATGAPGGRNFSALRGNAPAQGGNSGSSTGQPNAGLGSRFEALAPSSRRSRH